MISVFVRDLFRRPQIIRAVASRNDEQAMHHQLVNYKSNRQKNSHEMRPVSGAAVSNSIASRICDKLDNVILGRW